MFEIKFSEANQARQSFFTCELRREKGVESADRFNSKTLLVVHRRRRQFRRTNREQYLILVDKTRMAATAGMETERTTHE